MAEREIIAAAEELLRERPFRELTVDEVMRRTELSRPSFYVYFRDRHHLVLRVVERFGAEMWTMSERWFEGTGPGGLRVRDALEGVVAVFERHGPVLHALADAATVDPDVELAYNSLVQGFIDATAHAHRGGDRGGADPAARRAGDRGGADLDERALPALLARAHAERGARDGGRDARDDLDADALRREQV